jgi:PilZ domain
MISRDQLRRLLSRPVDSMRQRRSWLRALRARDARRAARYPANDALVAYYYWDGGGPIAHPVRDISSSGLYLQTDARWYPGTVVRVTLQGVGENPACVEIPAKIVRWDAEGLALVFIGDAEDVSAQLHPISTAVNQG